MVIEPERYELFEDPAYTFTLDRREFLGAAGVFLTLMATPEALAQGAAPGARLHVADDGMVTVFTGKVEFGQGARTEVAMAVAEEMRIAVDKVRVVMGDTELTPNDGITAGSRTTPSTIPAVRKAAAAARKLLPEGSVTAVKDWQVLGKPRVRADGKAIVTGEHKFPSDISRPGMLYGAVLRAPSFGAKLVSVNMDAANGVAAKVNDSGFIGCAAATSFAARQAVEALAKSAEWAPGPNASSAELFETLKHSVRQDREPRVQTKGTPDKLFVAADKSLKATYHVPFIQHAPMEPRAAVAEWSADGKLTVWTGTQNPFGVRDQLAQAFRIAPAKVRVIVPDTGGGFGGKHTGEVAIEAARLARESGKPVKLRWTRSEEFTWAYFRPAGLFEVDGSLDDSGKLLRWDFANYNAGTAAIESPYDTPHSRTRFFYCESPLREGSYRGIAATANNFSRECFIDEMAAKAAADPVEFRIANLQNNSRLRDVVAAAAKKFRWTERRRPGRGVGVACGTEKGSYVAACAAVDTTGGQVRVVEICMAFECGAILNPLNLRAQVEGSIIQGLGGALREEIEFSRGRIVNGSFAKYPVPRFKDVPLLDIVLLDRRDLAPAGAGETPIIAVAPAIANAVSAATGKRVRAMPVRVPA